MAPATNAAQDTAAASRPATPEGRPSKLSPALKLLAASAVLLQVVNTYTGATAAETAHDVPASAGAGAAAEEAAQQQRRRRLQDADDAPSYMAPLFDELKERRKLMEETPPEEVKYWFEYAGPLQVREKSFMICIEGNDMFVNWLELLLWIGREMRITNRVQRIVHPKSEVTLRLRITYHNSESLSDPFDVHATRRWDRPWTSPLHIHHWSSNSICFHMFPNVSY